MTAITKIRHLKDIPENDMTVLVRAIRIVRSDDNQMQREQGYSIFTAFCDKHSYEVQQAFIGNVDEQVEEIRRCATKDAVDALLAQWAAIEPSEKVEMLMTHSTDLRFYMKDEYKVVKREDERLLLETKYGERAWVHFSFTMDI